MTVIRELRTRFTAEAKALKKAFQSIQKDANALAKSNKALNDAFKKTNKQTDVTTKRFKTASGQVYALNKSLDQTPKIAKRVDKSINTVNKGVYNLNKSFSETPVVAKRVVKSVGDIGKTVTDVNKVVAKTPNTVKKASDSMGAMNKTVYTLNKNFSDTPKMAKRAVTEVSSVRQGLEQATTQTGKFNQAIRGIRTYMTTSGKNVLSTVNNMKNSLSSIPPVVSNGAITTRKSIMSGIVAPFREATNVVKGYAAVLGLLSAGSLAATGMGRLSAIENAQVSLEVMMGDAERAKGFLDDVLSFAKTTPFAFPDLAETARNLVAFGMDEAKVIPTMKAIGDAAAGSGKGAEGLNQIAGAFGDMQVSGTLSMDQINRLASAGVPALKILANQTGMSVDEMKKEISSGTMSSVQAIDDLVKGMQEGTDGVAGATASMGGLMEKMKDTWVGSVDSMKSSISSGMANLMEPIKVPLQDFMKWFGDSFGIMVTGILNFFGMMKPAAEPLKVALSDLRSFVQSLGRAVKNLFRALQPVASLVGMTLVGVFTVLAQVLKSVIAPTLEYISGMKIFAPIIAGVVTYILAYRSALIAAIAIQKTGNVLTKVSIALAKAQRAAHLAMVVSGGGVRGMLLALNAAMRALNLTMLKNPFVLVAAILIGLGASLYTAYKRSETFQKAVSKAFEVVKDAVVAVGDVVVNTAKVVGSFFSSVGKNIADWFNASFMPVLNDIASTISQFGGEIADWFMNSFIVGMNNMLSQVKKSGQKVASYLGEGISTGLESASLFVGGVGGKISDAINASIDSTVQAFESVGQRISDSIANGLIGRAGDIVKRYFESLIESFQSFSGVATLVAPSLIGMGARMLGITGPVGLIISSIMTLINIFTELYRTNENFRNFIDNTWRAIQSVFSDVLKAIQPILDEFNKAFSEIAEELRPELAKTKEVIADSINELKPTFQELGETFAELGVTFADLFKEIGQVVGDVIKEIVPLWVEFQLTLVTTIGEIVKVVIPSLLEVFKSVFPMILDIVKSVISMAVEVFTMLIDVVLEIVEAALPMLLSVVQSVLPVILNLVKTVLPLVMNLFTALIDLVLELVKVVVPMILSVVKAVLPMFLKIIKSVLPMVISIFTSLIDVVMELVKAVLPMVLSIVKSVFPMILNIIKTVLPIVIDLITSVVNIILELAKAVIPMVLRIVQMAFPIIQMIIETAMKVAMAVLEALVTVIQKVVVPAIEFILKIVQTVFPVITKVIEGALNIVIGILEFFISLFTGNWSGMWEAIKKVLKSALDIIWSVIKGTFDLIALFIKTIFTAISRFFSAIWSGITKIFKTVISAIYNFIKDRFTAIKNTTTTIFTTVWNFLKGIWNKVKNFIFDTVSNIFTRVRNTWNDLKTRTSEIFGGIYDGIKSKFDDIVDAAKKLPGRIGDGLKSMADKVKEGAKSVVNKMGGLLEDGLNGVIGGINWVLDKIGVSKNNQINEVTIPEFAKGGTHKGGLMIVGDGGKQELIRTPDGETMLSPDTDTLVNAPKGTTILSGEDTEEYLNDIPKYKSGNTSIADFAKSAWDATKRGANKVKNVTVDTGKVVGNAAKSGAKKVAEWTGNVWDYVKEPGKLLNIALKTLGIETPKGGSFTGDIAKAGFTMIKDKAVDFIKEKLDVFSSSAPSSSSGVQRWSIVASRALQMTGQYTKDNLDRLLYQMQTESGGNPKAINLWDSNAKRGTPSKGLMQVIDPTFRAHAMPGFNQNIWDPLSNMLASIRYAVSRYGSLARAYRGVGYADGGIVNSKQLAWIAEGGWAESIISHDPSKRVRQQRIWQDTGDRLGFTDDKSNKEILFELKRIAKAVEEGKDLSVVMDSRTVGELVEPHVTNKQQRKQNRKRRMPKS
ncbi:tape measure protein [Oceanobacillus profundus]|uniref:tape measure protein n=1 Tax=Oceanobacillus profundus TaxID=372463 RepID=UPI00203DEBD0|nr:tape measure protein [Oceanobacillus profundus]MCM3396491.1 tape measure protein [Oceanobacillus profundus]